LPENYKLLIKAFGSKNVKVLLTAFKIIKELGELDDRASEYVES
jgi:hypothetical protein